MATFHSGSLGKAKFDTAELHVTSWTCSFDDPPLDTTNTGTNRYETGIYSVSKASGQITADWDSDPVSSPATIPPKIGRFAVLTNVELYIGDPANGKKHVFPSVLVTQTAHTSEVKGKVSYTVQWQSNGTFTVAT